MISSHSFHPPLPVFPKSCEENVKEKAVADPLPGRLPFCTFLFPSNESKQESTLEQNGNKPGMNRDILSARSSFSSTSSDSDAAGADWIAPAERLALNALPPDTRPKSRRISSALDIDEAGELWLRMVELQERYGCYRSARMQAAVSAESPADFMRKYSAPRR